jgi:hypothetical protein
MAAKQWYLNFPTAFTSAGYVAAGAKAYFYLPGTSTLTTVYSDATLTTATSNPVVANGAGRFPDVYLDVDLTYRVRITDADDVLLDESDPYTPEAAGPAAASAAAAAISEAAAIASAASASDDAADAALMAAAAEAFNNGWLFDTSAEGVSQGVVSLTITAPGATGANGQFALAFSGGGGSGAAGTFTVSGGAVTAVNLTKRGKSYTSNPTVSVAASAGLAGATVTAAKGNYAVPDGEYYLVKGTSDTFASLYKNVGGVATNQNLDLPSLAGVVDVASDVADALELANTIADAVGEFETQTIGQSTLSSGVAISDLTITNQETVSTDGTIVLIRVRTVGAGTVKVRAATLSSTTMTPYGTTLSLVAGGAGDHTFTTNLPVNAGDYILVYGGVNIETITTGGSAGIYYGVGDKTGVASYTVVSFASDVQAGFDIEWFTAVRTKGLSLAAYNAIVTKDPSTLYLIV